MELRGILEQVGELFFRPRDPLTSRRQEERVLCDFPVNCDLGGGRVWEARLLDVSAHGMRLRCAARLKRRQIVHVSPLGGFLGLRCVVRWVREGEVGLRYEDTPERIASSWVQVTLRRAEQLLRKDRRLPAGVEVELQEPDGRWLARGVLLDLGLRGALVRAEVELAEDTNLRLRVGSPEGSLYLLARVVGKPAPRQYNVTFFPGYKSEQERLRRLLLSLLEAIERGEAPVVPPAPPAPPGEPAPGLAESLVTDFQIPGRLSLGGSLDEVLGSPLPDFNLESLLASVALAEDPAPSPAPAASEPPAPSPSEEWEALRGWAAQLAPGEPSGLDEPDQTWWYDLVTQAEAATAVHAVVASLALGGTQAVRQVLMGTRLAVSLAQTLGITESPTLQLVRWAALLRDAGELAQVMGRQPSAWREAAREFLAGLTPLREGEELAGLRIPARLFLADRAGLTARELDRHPGIGRALVMSIPGLERLGPVLQAHHERWDGHGPLGLVGSSTPLVARCVALADFYATLRVRGVSEPEAVVTIQSGAGTWFNPEVVRAFSRLASPGP